MSSSQALAGTVVAGPLATGYQARSVLCVIVNTGAAVDTVTAQLTRRSGALLGVLPPTLLAPGEQTEVQVNTVANGERVTCSVTGAESRNVTLHTIGTDQGSRETVTASGS